MFIETYYDERAPVHGSTRGADGSLSGIVWGGLTVWREYLPIRRQIINLSSRLYTIPDPAIAELTLAQVKKRLWVEKWLLWLIATGAILGFFIMTLAIRAYGG